MNSAVSISLKCKCLKSHCALIFEAIQLYQIKYLLRMHVAVQHRNRVRVRVRALGYCMYVYSCIHSYCMAGTLGGE